MAGYEIFVQGIALLALIGLAGSFHARGHICILLWQIASLLLWTLHYALLAAWTGALLAAVNVVICAAFVARHQASRKEATSLVFALAALLAATLLAWEGFHSLWAFLAIAAMTVSRWLLSPWSMRCAAILGCFLWIVYNAFVGSWGGIVAEAMIILSILASLARKEEHGA